MSRLVGLSAAAGRSETDESEPTPRQGRGYRWAEVMRRTFGFDVLACPRCGGRLRLPALIEQGAVIARILRHLGLPTELSGPGVSRAPPLPSGAGAGLMDDDAAFASGS